MREIIHYFCLFLLASDAIELIFNPPTTMIDYVRLGLITFTLGVLGFLTKPNEKTNDED